MPKRCRLTSSPIFPSKRGSQRPASASIFFPTGESSGTSAFRSQTGQHFQRFPMYAARAGGIARLTPSQVSASRITVTFRYFHGSRTMLDVGVFNDIQRDPTAVAAGPAEKT
jgi:hypothetical protein